MKNYFFCALVCCVTVFLMTLPVYGQSIQIVADEFPPYNYTEEGKVTGLGTEIVQALLQEVGIEANIQVLPWARAYKMAQEEKNVLIYTIARTPQREDLFKWIGLVVEQQGTLFVLKSRDDIVIGTLDDAHKYRVGSVIEDARTQYLISQGFDEIDQVSSNETNMKKLLRGRIDIWVEDELTAYYLLKQNGHEPQDTVKILYQFPLGGGGHIAFSSSTSDELVEKFKQAYEKIKQDGTYERILGKYKS